MPVARRFRNVKVDFVPATVGREVHRVERHDEGQTSINPDVKFATAGFRLFPNVGVQHNRGGQPAQRAGGNVKDNFGGWLEKDGFEGISRHGNIPHGHLLCVASHQPGLFNVFEALKYPLGIRSGWLCWMMMSRAAPAHAYTAQLLFEPRGVLAQMTDLNLEGGQIVFMKWSMVRMNQIGLKPIFHSGASVGV